MAHTFGFNLVPIAERSQILSILNFAYCWQSMTRGGNGLGTRLYSTFPRTAERSGNKAIQHVP